MKPGEFTVSIQRGHCFRTSGSTGTRREQEFTNRLGHEMQRRFAQDGMKAHLLTADEWIPPCDLFIALHIDGSGNINRRGTSLGYPSDSGASSHAVYGRLLQRKYAELGYEGGYLPDNYTRNLRYYYGFNKVRATVELLFEHGFGTNKQDENFMFANIGRIAKVHVDTAKQHFNIHAAEKYVGSNWPGRYLKLQSPFMKGLDAAWVQQVGNMSAHTLKVDGVYGGNTEAFVKNFQRQWKLSVDGIVGPKTWAVMNYFRSLKNE